MTASPTFAGFHPDALPFFRELRENNERSFWLANKTRYDEHVKAPMVALGAALEGVFGEPHLFRPYRDVRFSKDKRPYKLQVSMVFGGNGPMTVGSRYVQLDGEGLYAGGGAYMLAPESLARFRTAVGEERSGAELVEILSELEHGGYAVEGETLQRPPRGFEADHPRIRLLKHKGIYVGRSFGPAAWLYRPEALDRVAKVFGDVEPLVVWLRRHVG